MSDKSLFNLQIEGFSGKLAVLSFDLAEGIHYNDLLSANLVYSGGLSEAIIGKGANFSFEFEGKKAFYNGIITRYSRDSSAATSDVPGVTVTIKTLQYSMDKTASSAVYYKTDVETIARSLVKKNGVLKTKYELNSHYEIDFKVQYNETDLDFLRRLLKGFSIVKYVRHSENGSELVINDNGVFEKAELNLVKSSLDVTENGSFLHGSGHVPLRPGMEVSAFDETFVIFSVSHNGSQEAAMGIKSGNEGYSCNIFALSKRMLSKLPSEEENKTALQVPGVIVAKVEGFKGSPAHLDDQGRYVVRMPFDEENEGTATSCPVHAVQSFAGEDSGMHFPLRKDTSVLIAFENGNMDKPVILGALPDEACKSPVAKDNSYQNVIKTISGIKFVLDDKSESLDIEVPKNISIKAEKENISIKAEKENISVKAEKELTLEGSGKSVLKTKSGAKINLNDSGSLDIEGKNISVKASGKLVLKGSTVEIN